MRAPLLFCFIFIAGLVSGCGTGSSEVDDRTPEEVATAYLSAERDADWASAYALASSVDRAARDSVAFVEGQPSGNSAMEAKMRAVVSFEAIETTVDDSTATIVFDYTAADADALTADFMGAFMGRAMAGEEIDEAEVEEALNRTEIPTRTTRRTVELVREPSGWRVVRNWDYAEKVALSEVALEKSPGNAEWGIAPRATVRGELRNTGDRDVGLVRVRVVMLNADGAPFDETVAQAFYGTGGEGAFAAMGESPLRPGYVKEWAAYLDESVVDRVDSVRVEVADVELAE